MRNILLVIKNNLQRLIKEKFLLCIMAVIFTTMVYLGIFFSQVDEIKGNLAIVGAKVEQENIMREMIKNNNSVNLIFLDESPTKTELIKGIYLAEINLSKDEPEVISYGREDIKLLLEASLKGEVYEASSVKPSVESRIIGFLLMFLLFSSFMVMDNFLTDRENGVYVRVLNGKLSYFEYMIGQVLYSILVLTVPALILSLLILKILAVELTMSIGLVVVLITLVGLLSSSFSILISTLCKKKVSVVMGGSAITMISCLLGGCIVNIVDTNKIMGFFRDLIPQKRLIDLANEFNNNDLIFVVAIIIIFLGISLVIGKKQYENGEFI